ncbi:asparaginase [Krasilnikovia sp. M28-CT-15]|uniref:asparaginase n=1 Tax=Krasilnikovia sp. M28-CT-15 TaxID=3373540 RepID=UPI0038760890
MTSRQHARIALYSLGGTIAMTPQASGGVAPALSARELLSAVPGLAETGIEVDVHDFRRLPGASLSFGDLRALATDIKARVADGVDGIVVTQGTDTIEETAFLLDLLHTGDAPLVITGAMRSATAAGADGPANLLASLRTAANRKARGLGCLVVFADEIHAARYVRKTHASSITAFTSQPGPIGYLVEGQVHVPLRPARGPQLADAQLDSPPGVAVVPAVLGDDGRVLAAVAGQVDGLVVGGFGVGHVPAAWVPILADAAARVPVVLTSRAGTGSVHASTYGFAGSERDLLDRGLISAGSLDTYKARILLTLLLAGKAERAEIVAAFGLY